MKLWFVALASWVSLPAAAAGIGSAPPKQDDRSLSVSLYISDEDGGKRTPALETTLTIAGDKDCASLVDRTSTTHYEVVICRDGGEDARPVLRFEITRKRTDGDERRIHTRISLALGKRVVIGRHGQESRPIMVLEAEARPSSGG